MGISVYPIAACPYLHPNPPLTPPYFFPCSSSSSFSTPHSLFIPPPSFILSPYFSACGCVSVITCVCVCGYGWVRACVCAGETPINRRSQNALNNNSLHHHATAQRNAHFLSTPTKKIGLYCALNKTPGIIVRWLRRLATSTPARRQEHQRREHHFSNTSLATSESRRAAPVLSAAVP